MAFQFSMLKGVPMHMYVTLVVACLVIGNQKEGKEGTYTETLRGREMPSFLFLGEYNCIGTLRHSKYSTQSVLSQFLATSILFRSPLIKFHRALLAGFKKEHQSESFILCFEACQEHFDKLYTGDKNFNTNGRFIL